MTSKSNRWINTTARTISVSAECMQNINIAMGNNKKIQAIKLLRAETGAGLRDAKLAIEKHFGIGHSPVPRLAADDIYRIIPRFKVYGFKIEMGSGVVEVDLEGMQLHALMQMQTVGIDECQNILELVKLIKGWADVVGADTGVDVDDSSEEPSFEYV